MIANGGRSIASAARRGLAGASLLAWSLVLAGASGIAGSESRPAPAESGGQDAAGQRQIDGKAAIEKARQDERVGRLLRRFDDLRANAGFLSEHRCWIVRFSRGDREVVFATVSPAGMVLEVGLREGAERGEGGEGIRQPIRLPPPPFVLCCSPDERSDPPATLLDEAGAPIPVLADREFGAEWGYGHSGGKGFRHWHPAVWGYDPAPFASGRIDPRSYRFALPEGDYLIAIGFCESFEHSARRRVFDLLIGGRIVEADLDPFAVAGFFQAFQSKHLVSVRGGEGLAIEFRAKGGSPPLVNAIWVSPAPGKPPAPSPPSGFRAIGSYGMNFLFWDHAGGKTTAGYQIERRLSDTDPFSPVTPGPVPVARWIDRDVTPGRPYEYRIRAVDLWGRSGEWSPPGSAIPRDLGRSTLPVCSIELPEEGLAYLHGDVREERTVAGQLSLGDAASYPVEIRIRGASSRSAAKTSYRIAFRGKRPPGKPDVIYLKAQSSDYTLQQEKLACDVFRALGVPISETSYVNLSMGGRYQGIYLDIEPVRSPFKERAGLDPGGTLIRSATFEHLDGGRIALDDAKLRGEAGSVADLREFLLRLNRVERGEFEPFLRATTDWPRVRDYFIGLVLTHRTEVEADDFFYYRDPTSGRWSLVSWDNNNGNFGVEGCAVRLGSPRVSPFFSMSFPECEHPFWYVLPSRIFHDERLRKEYLDRLEESVREIILSGRLDRMIRANRAALDREIGLDPFRWPPGRDEPFARSADDLSDFARRNGSRILRQIEEERRREPPRLVLNEFLFGAEAGWVEIANRSASPIAIDGHELATVEGRRDRQFRVKLRGTIEARGYRVIEVSRGDRHGFDPSGGTIGLFASGEAPSDDDPPIDDRPLRDQEPRRRVLDWCFYGRQTPGFSYGRTGDGFAPMLPTPGRTNGAGLTPAPVLADGGLSRRGDRIEVEALVTQICPGKLESVALHYRRGGEWRRQDMEVEGDRAVARLGPEAMDEEKPSYFFVARSPDGLERRAPLTAPSEVYSGRRSR